MRANHQRHRYQTDGMQSVSQERLLILLYERVQRDLSEARGGVESGSTETRHNALLHAQEIVEELAYAVRPDLWTGGDSLLALYDYLLGLLVRANIDASITAIEEADTIVGGLLAAWREAYVAVSPAAAPA